jgi:hypothetical protein
MYPIVEAYQNRENTQEEFCAQHKTSKAVLQYWQSKYNRERKGHIMEELFQPIDLNSDTKGRHIEIRTLEGLVIRIPI